MFFRAVEAAHKLKGGAGALSATRLHGLCEKAQGMGAATPEARSIILDDIQDSYMRVVEALDRVFGT